MGLDMYAYAAVQPNQEWNDNNQREIAYWRKHPNLHGWMERLWVEKGRYTGTGGPDSDPTFNGIELELTWEDLDQLEQDITNNQLPHTTGFFFGENSDEYYRNEDLEFVKKARVELFSGLKVFYNSSW